MKPAPAVDYFALDGHDRTFAWGPDGALLYSRASDLYVRAGGRARRLGRPQLLDRIGSVRGRLNRVVSFSPNGRLAAASVAGATIVLRADGSVLRVVPGHLLNWSGDGGVLTEVVDRLIPTLFRFPLAGRGGRPLERPLQGERRNGPGRRLVRLRRHRYADRRLPPRGRVGAPACEARLRPRGRSRRERRRPDLRSCGNLSAADVD